MISSKSSCCYSREPNSFSRTSVRLLITVGESTSGNLVPFLALWAPTHMWYTYIYVHINSQKTLGLIRTVECCLQVALSRRECAHSPLLCRLTVSPFVLQMWQSKGIGARPAQLAQVVCLYRNVTVLSTHINLKVKKCSAFKDKLTYFILGILTS